MQRPPRSLLLAAALGAISSLPTRAAPASIAVGTRPGVDAPAPTRPSAGPAARRAASEAALAVLTRTSPNARALWRPGLPGPSIVTGLAEETSGASPEERALSFVKANEHLFGVSASDLDTLLVQALHERHVVRFRQLHGGEEVVGRTLTVTLDASDRVMSLANDLVPVGALAPATIDLERARTAALGAVGAAGGSAGKRVVVADESGAYPAALFFVARPGTLEAYEVVVSLSDGRVSSIDKATRK